MKHKGGCLGGLNQCLREPSDKEQRYSGILATVVSDESFVSSEAENVYYRNQFVVWRCFSFEILLSSTVKLLKLLRVEDSLALEIANHLS